MSIGALIDANRKRPRPRLNLPLSTNNLYIILIVSSILSAFVLNQPLLLGIPVVALILYVALVDFKSLFFCLFALIPLSFEYNFPNGLGTDLPDEPLMWLLTGVAGVYLLANLKNLSARFFLHPITLLLFLHLIWFLISTVQAQSVVFSLKFFAAKIWYVVCFYFLSYFFLRTPTQRKRLFWMVLIPLLTTVIIVFAREAAIGFAFKNIHFVMGPFYRNHVAYASIIALFLPFVYQRSIDPSISKLKRNFLKICLVFLLVALFFSFTRAAILAVVAAMGFIWVIRLKMVRYMVFSVSIAILLGVAYLAKDNRYLEFAPNFDTTVMQDQFGNLINATYQLEDISTMERVYRWVAGFNMIVDYPWFGVGPGNFYNAYQSYTITSFKTYVSNNPEHSGIHSYYLMTTVEQGIIGGVLYLLFVFAVFLYGERVYHRLERKEEKNELLAYLLCFFIICILQIINDLIETDKVGPFFWLSVAMIVRAGLSSAKQIDTNTVPKIEV